MQNGTTRKMSRILLPYNTFLYFHIFKKIMKKSNISIIRKNIAMNKFAVSSYPMLKFWTPNSQMFFILQVWMYILCILLHLLRKKTWLSKSSACKEAMNFNALREKNTFFFFCFHFAFSRGSEWYWVNLPCRYNVVYTQHIYPEWNL